MLLDTSYDGSFHGEEPSPMDDTKIQSLRLELHKLFTTDFKANIEITGYTDGETPQLGFTYKLHKGCFCSNNSFFCDRPCCKNIIEFVIKITKAVNYVLTNYRMTGKNLNELGITCDLGNFTFDSCKIDKSNLDAFKKTIVYPFAAAFGLRSYELFSKPKTPLVNPNNSQPIEIPFLSGEKLTSTLDEEKNSQIVKPRLDDGDPYVLGGGSHSRRKRRTSKKSRKSRGRRRHRRSSHNKKRHTKRHTKRYRKRK